jgi:hypothetical protein
MDEVENAARDEFSQLEAAMDRAGTRAASRLEDAKEFEESLDTDAVS